MYNRLLSGGGMSFRILYCVFVELLVDMSLLQSDKWPFQAEYLNHITRTVRE